MNNMDPEHNPSRQVSALQHLLPAVLTLAMFLTPPVRADERCAELLTSRCETCHYATRVCQKVEKEMSKKHWFGGPEGVWKRTVRNMVRQGAILNDAEEKILVECLSKPTAEVLSLCKLNK